MRKVPFRISARNLGIRVSALNHF